MISQTTIQNTIRTWTSLIFPDTKVVFREATTPSGCRPSLPYIGIKFMGITSIGQNYQSQPNIDEESYITGVREFVISFQYYGPNAKTELELMTILNKKDENIQYLLDNGGISYIQDLGIIDISTLRDTVYEQRANMDITFRIGSQIVVDAPIVETVEIKGEIKDYDDSVLKSIDEII